MNEGRKEKILKILEDKGELQLNTLAQVFPEVSTMTLRRDLISLEKKGLLIRTHGGAVNTKKVSFLDGEEYEYSRRAIDRVEEKNIIATKANLFLEKGRSIFLDAGSTMMKLAEKIDNDSYSIVTSGVNIALELLKKQRISTVLLGGVISSYTLSCSGPNSIAAINDMNVDIAFMSASGFSVDRGFTVSNMYECELKRKVIQNAKKVIILMDSSKINKDQTFTYAYLEDVDIWICDKEVSQEILKELKEHGVLIA